MKADCALIGGASMERLAYTIKLRRLGFSTFTELSNRKRDKMFKRACEETRWGKGGVYDLDDPQDRAWLDRADLATAGI